MEGESYSILFYIFFAVVTISTIIINFTGIAFFVSYIFFWKRMRAWFNKKAGVDFMPQKRIGRDLRPIVIAGGVFSVIVIIVNIFGTEDMANKIGFIAMMGLIAWSVARYRKLKPVIGGQAAKWAAIFHFGSSLIILGLTITIAVFAAMICIAILLFSAISDYATDSMSPKSSYSNPIKGVGKMTEWGEKVTADQHADGTFRDFHGREYRENSDGTLRKK